METPITPDVDGGFIRTMQTHQKGKVISDLSEAIRNVTAAVRQHAKAGRVVLTMTITPATKGNENALGFECDVVQKQPRGEAYAGLFFADDHNNLVRENPHQEQLPALRSLGGALEEEPMPMRKMEEI